MLILLLSLALGSNSWAQTSVHELHERRAAAFREAQAINAQATVIEDDLQALVRRAVYPNEPGTAGAPPTASELETVESRIHACKRDMEDLFARFASSSPEQLELDTMRIPHQGILNKYMNMISSLHLARASLGLSITQSDLRNWKVHVPAYLAQEMILNHEGHRSPLEITQASSDLYRVGLNRDIFIGQEVGVLAHSDSNGPGSERLLAFAQLQSVLQGAEALAAIRALLGPTVSLPDPEPLPATVRSAAPSFGSLRTAISRAQERGRNERLRSALSNSFTRLKEQLVPMPDMESLARTVLSTQIGTNRRSSGPIPEAIRALRDILQESFSQHLQEGDFRFQGAIPTEEAILRTRLRTALADWCTAPLLNVLSAQQELETLEIGPNAQRSIDRAFELLRNDLATRISDEALRRWISDSQAETERIRLDARHRWISEVYKAARAAAERPEQAQEIEPVTLFMTLLSSRLSESSASFRATLSDRIRNLQNPRPGIINLTQDSWEILRTIYNARMVELSSSHVIVNGVLNPSLVEAWLETHDFRPPVSRYRRMPRAIAEGMRENAARLAREELRGMLDIGRLLRFHRRWATPTLSDLRLTSEERDLYLMLRRDSQASRFPFLSMELPPGHPGVGSNEEPLAPVLARQSRLETLDANGIATAWRVLEPALRILDRQIRERMSRIVRTRDWASIRADANVLISSRLIVDPDRAYSVATRQLAQILNEPSHADLIFNGYLDPYVVHGVTAIMAVQIVNWGARRLIRRYTPFGDVLAKQFVAPISNGFMRSLLVFGTAHTVFLGIHAAEAEELAHAAEGAASSDFLGQRSPSYTEVLAYRGDASRQRFFFRIAAIGDVVAFGIPYIVWPLIRPIAGPLLEPMIARVAGWASRLGSLRAAREIRRDLEAFETLSLPPGAWTRETIEDASRTATAVEGISHSRRGAIEAAEAHLLRRIERGETWSIAEALRGEQASRPLTEAEQRLRRALGLPRIVTEGGTR